MERYVRNVAEDVRDIQSTVIDNNMRLLSLDERSRLTHEETLEQRTELKRRDEGNN